MDFFFFFAKLQHHSYTDLIKRNVHFQSALRKLNTHIFIVHTESPIHYVVELRDLPKK